MMHVDNRLETTLGLNIQGIQHSLNTMPDGAYNTYCRWMLNQPELNAQWLQLTGITALAKLTRKLLGDLITADEWTMLTPYISAMNTYLTYEVVSDNIAIGLAHRTPGDKTYTARAQLLYTFNEIIEMRLKGQISSAQEALSPTIPLTRNISAFDQSLSPNKHRDLAQAFLMEHENVIPDDLEYSLYPALIANIESCIDLVKTIRNPTSAALVKNSMISRYIGVRAVLESSVLSTDEILQIGVNTVSVIPVVGFYVAILCEEIRPSAYYCEILEDGLLQQVLNDAALIVRLLNDMGPCLLEPGPEQKWLFKSLHAARNWGHSLDELLLDKSYAGLLTRLVKDIKHGEFNVCLHEPERIPYIPAAISSFCEQVEYLTGVYVERCERLQASLKMLTERLHDPLISSLIWRFVAFHQEIYSNPSDDIAGEYAI